MKIISLYHNFKLAIIFLYLVLFGYSSILYAVETRYFSRSPRALLMGDAFTAVADDEYTLFYNPAALSRNTGLHISIVNPRIGLVNALDEVDRFQDFPSDDPAGIAEKIIGLPFFLEVGGVPSIKVGSFGFNYLANVRTNIVLQNKIYPVFDIDASLDQGFILGYAFPFGEGGKGRLHRKKSTAKQGEKYSVGVGLKSLTRKGINNVFDLFGLEILNIISNSNTKDMNAILDDLGYSEGSALGFDVGFEYSRAFSNSLFNAGVSIIDVGKTSFTVNSGTAQIADQEMQINLGTAWSQSSLFLDYTISADVRPINQSLDFARMVHLGFELNLPVLGIMLGYGEGYLSYGLSINLWLLKMYAGFYGVETGGSFLQNKAGRAIFSLQVLSFDFDI